MDLYHFLKLHQIFVISLGYDLIGLIFYMIVLVFCKHLEPECSLWGVILCTLFWPILLFSLIIMFIITIIDKIKE